MKRHLLSRTMLANLFVLGLLGIWFLTLAPTVMKGPAGYIEVSGHSMDGTYRTGDLILTRQQDTYAKGDIITFKVDNGGQVIHRIIGGNGSAGYTTQGDNNPDPDPWHPTDPEVVGKAWHRFEGKAWLLHLPRQPWFAGVTAGLLTLVVLGIDALPRRRRADDKPAAVGDSELLETPAAATDEALPRIPAQRTTSAPLAPAATSREAARQAALDAVPSTRRSRRARTSPGTAGASRWRRR